MEEACATERILELSLQEDPERWNKLTSLVDHYRGEKGSLVTVLQQTQAIYGYLPNQAIQYLSQELQIKTAKIYGVATFYTQFRFTPVGKHLILQCQGTACHVNNSERISTAICEKLGIAPGETTPDMLFTLNHVACLGCCSLAPVMMIDGRAYGPLTPNKAVKIIEDIIAAEGGRS